VEEFATDMAYGHTQVVDLHALALKRRLWLAARLDRSFEGLLARVESIHCCWLLSQERFIEAEERAMRALSLMPTTLPISVLMSDDDWPAAALNAAACCSNLHRGNSPAATARLIRRWLPRMIRQEDQAKAQCDLAYYTAQAGHMSAALACLEQTRHMVLAPAATAPLLRYYQVTLARMLAQAGKFGAALAALPSPDPVRRYKDLFPLLVRAEMLCLAGQRNEAHSVAQRLYADLERLPSPRLRKRLDHLAAQL
jgi:hypothetical protein